MTHVPLTLRHEPSRDHIGRPLDTWAIWVRYLPGIVGEVAKTWRQGLRGPELMPLVGVDPDGGEWGWEPIRRAA